MIMLVVIVVIISSNIIVNTIKLCLYSTVL